MEKSKTFEAISIAALLDVMPGSSTFKKIILFINFLSYKTIILYCTYTVKKIVQYMYNGCKLWLYLNLKNHFQKLSEHYKQTLALTVDSLL